MNPAADDGADEQFCYLTTRGRVTGEPHEIEIWFAHARDGATLYLLAGDHHSDWVRNVRADPDVTVRIRHLTFPAVGRVVDDAAEDRVARDMVFAKYSQGSDLVGWRESALPVALDLKPSAG